MEEIEIISANESHLHEIQYIMNDAVLHTTAIYDYHERDEAYMKQWFSNKLIQQMPVLVAVNKEQHVLGYGSFGVFRPFDGFQFCVENSLYVHPQHQGKSIGKLLLAALIQAAEQKSFHTMVAVIDAENEKSVALHEKFGFSVAGKLNQAGFKFQKWLDLLFMQKMLK